MFMEQVIEELNVQSEKISIIDPEQRLSWITKAKDAPYFIDEEGRD